MRRMATAVPCGPTGLHYCFTIVHRHEYRAKICKALYPLMRHEYIVEYGAGGSGGTITPLGEAVAVRSRV